MTTAPEVFPTDESHRPDLESWVESASDTHGDFPVQNLPLGMFRHPGGGGDARPGVAIGEQVLDLEAAYTLGLLAGATGALVAECVAAGALNPLMRAGRDRLAQLRRQVSALLRADTPQGGRARADALALLVPSRDVELLLPARVGDYTDFYASIHHATNVGSMFRPDNALLPNYKWVPIGYHGRASSIVASGSSVRRPSGQTRDDAAAPPLFGPTKRLDYEMEVGAFIGRGNDLGSAIPLGDAEQHVVGLCLVNDWSARDIQAWEYQPLGPFLAKNFATTVSPWIVTLDALAPFRVPATPRAADDPAPLPYLMHADNERAGGVGIALEVSLTTTRMRAEAVPPFVVSRGRFTDMYWTVAQLVTHHASNGCNLQAGDLLASGTVSGASADSRGCLLERTWRGSEPLTLPTGEVRRFLEDGDEVIMRGWCERAGFRRIGFGECRGQVVAAH